MDRQALHRRAVHPGPESGVTGLETAIILISFVVVASVFAYAMLGSGLIAAEKSKETVRAELRRAAHRWSCAAPFWACRPRARLTP